jgi:hypothetical protein
MSCDVILKRVTLSRDELSQLPEDECHLLVHLGNLGNELSILYKYLVSAVTSVKDAEPEHTASLVKTEFLLKLVAGTVYEAHTVLRRDFCGDISQRWSADIPRSIVDLQRRIFGYFDGPNVIKTIRNKYAFHSDRVDPSAALAKVPDDPPL